MEQLGVSGFGGGGYVAGEPVCAADGGVFACKACRKAEAMSPDAPRKCSCGGEMLLVESPAQPSRGKPNPAPNQVWLVPKGGSMFPAGGVVALGDGGPVCGSLFFKVNGHDGSYNVTLGIKEGWQCIGLQLPDGRRMLVGETWDVDMGRSGTVRHVLVAVGARPGGAEFLEADGGVMGFDSALAGDSSRWRKVEEGPARVATTPEEADRMFGRASGIGDVMRRAAAGAKSATLYVVVPPPLPSPEGIAALRALGEAFSAVFSTREFRRGLVDEVLRDDARRFPAFATARRAAVMAACERHPEENGPRGAEFLIEALHIYENARGGGRQPSDLAKRHRDAWGDPTIVDAYERSRALP